MPLRAQGSRHQADPIEGLIQEGAYRDAAAMLARVHARAVGRLCMALLGDQAEADEAMQEALLAAHRAMPSFRGEGSVRSWLLCIARRVCARRIALRVRRDQPLQLIHAAAAPGASPAEQVESKRLARRLRQALGELKPSERDLVLLRYEAGLPFREIAESMGIEEVTARKRASRALRRLRKLLKDEIER